jgi:HD-like signal output (HDOD) protein
MIAVHWGLPSAVASAIQYHHGPREAVESDLVASLVAHSNLLVERAAAGDTTAAASVFDAETLAFLDIDAGAIPAWIEHVESALATREE